MTNADIAARAKKLVARLFESMKDVGGTQGLPSDVLQEAVSADTEAAAAAVPALLQAATQNRGLYQIALAVAGAYEAETKDDSLTRTVEAALGKLATPLKPIRYVDPDAPAGAPSFTSLPTAPKISVIAVDKVDLAKGDVFPLVRLFRIDEAKFDAELIRGLRGRMVLTFPVDDDPRPIWQIPSVRKHQQKLFAQVPYFPYYLDPKPAFAMFLAFFGPLVDASAVNAEGVNLGHPSLVGKVVASMKAVSSLAKRLGESPDEVCRSVLQAAPADFVDEILELAKE